MAALTEAAFSEIVARGCSCGSKKLRFEAIVPGEIKTFLGDPLAQPRWTYEGEDFVAAVHRIACTTCGKVIVERSECPVCGSAGGAARALAREPELAVPDRCRCGFEELVVRVLVPVAQEHDGEHAKKPAARVVYGEPGFQPTQVSCASCKSVLGRASGCAACGAA